MHFWLEALEFKLFLGTYRLNDSKSFERECSLSLNGTVSVFKSTAVRDAKVSEVENEFDD